LVFENVATPIDIETAFLQIRPKSMLKKSLFIAHFLHLRRRHDRGYRLPLKLSSSSIFISNLKKANCIFKDSF
jgi:hypothetical protein